MTLKLSTTSGDQVVTKQGGSQLDFTTILNTKLQSSTAKRF